MKFWRKNDQGIGKFCVDWTGKKMVYNFLHKSKTEIQSPDEKEQVKKKGTIQGVDTCYNYMCVYVCNVCVRNVGNH